MDVRGKVVGELWRGSFPFVRAACQRYGAKCAYICVDKLGQKEIEKKYAEWDLADLFALPNVMYVQHNCEEITSRDWNVWCGHFGRAMADTLGLEASIECTTWTLAAKATSSHRKANGAAISMEAQRMTPSPFSKAPKRRLNWTCPLLKSWFCRAWKRFSTHARGREESANLRREENLAAESMSSEHDSVESRRAQSSVVVSSRGKEAGRRRSRYSSNRAGYPA